MNVIVIGAGVIGLSTAYFLTQRGASVTVIDSAACVGDGASFANGGMITPSMSEPWNAPGVLLDVVKSLGNDAAPFLLRPKAIPSLLTWGPKFLKESSKKRFETNSIRNFKMASFSNRILSVMSRDLQLDFQQDDVGTAKIFRNTKSFENSIVRSEFLAKEGLKFSVLTRDEVLNIEPALEGSGDTIVGAIRYPGDQSGNAKAFCESLTDVLAKQGVRFVLGESVIDFIHSSNTVSGVQTDKNTFKAEKVVISAGAYSALLTKKVGIKLPVKPVKGYSLTLDKKGWNDSPSMPIVDDELHAAVTPLGNTIRVAGTAEMTGFDASLTQSRIDNLFSLLLNIYPSYSQYLNKNEANPWTGFRAVSASGVPIIGNTPVKNLYLNTGHGHLGWTMAAGSGKFLAELIYGEQTELDPSLFSYQH